MKRFISLFLMVLLLFSTPVSVGAVSPGNNSGMQRVIVMFKGQVEQRDFRQTVRAVSGTIEHEYETIPAMAITVSDDAIQVLKKNPNVEYVEPDFRVQKSAQTQDWGIAVTKAPDAWTSGLTGKGIKIAVIDTGIANHPDLDIAGGVAFTDYTGSYIDDEGHGTHVAGIIGAKNNDIGTVGIAPEASLYAVKVLDYNGEGWGSDTIRGIDWAIKNNMDIANLSLGGPTYNATYEYIINQAYFEKGLLIAAAAGNDGKASVDYPAKYLGAIAVGAVNQSLSRAGFSNTGNELEVTAPGVNVMSTCLNNNYEYMSGTSMSTPYVSGNLALLKQRYPNMTSQQLRDKQNTSVIDLGPSDRDTSYGYGLIQAPVNQISSFVTRYYRLCLGREPDPGGLNYWVTQLSAGHNTGATLALDFIFSPEFIARNVNDDEFLDVMYRTFFDRVADDSGKAYWLDTLRDGISRKYVLSCFVNSVEFSDVCNCYEIERGSIQLTEPADLHPKITAFVNRFYVKCLDRTPDESGINYWVNMLITGRQTGAGVARGFVFSTEMTAKNLSDNDFMNIMYRVFFNREPDSEGLAYWLDALNTDTSRMDVLAGFVNSPEFAQICNEYGIKVGSI